MKFWPIFAYPKLADKVLALFTPFCFSEVCITTFWPIFVYPKLADKVLALFSPFSFFRGLHYNILAYFRIPYVSW